MQANPMAYFRNALWQAARELQDSTLKTDNKFGVVFEGLGNLITDIEENRLELDQDTIRQAILEGYKRNTCK